MNKGADKADGRASSDLGPRPDSPVLRSPSGAAVSDDTTPATPAATRTSIDVKAADPAAQDAPAVEDEAAVGLPTTVPTPVATSPVVSPVAAPLIADQPTTTPVPTMSTPSIVTPLTTSPRLSLDSIPSRPSVDSAALSKPTVAISRDVEDVEAELLLLQKTYEETLRDNREEVNGHLERIDTLQSKLAYLSRQLASSANAASADVEAASQDKKLADKDVQIAALMEEGQKLSKTELKNLTTIKKMRAKAQEQDKELTVWKQRLTKAERSETEQSERAKRAEAAERSAQDKLKVVGKIEKDIESIRAEREEAGLTISELRKRLDEALLRAESAEKRAQAGALEVEGRVTASLMEDIENLRIEKKLAEDRAKRELQASRDEARNQQEKAKVAELELRGEIAVRFTTFGVLKAHTNSCCRIWNPSSSYYAAEPRKLLRQQQGTLKLSFSGKSKLSRHSTHSPRRTGRASKLL